MCGYNDPLVQALSIAVAAVSDQVRLRREGVVLNALRDEQSVPLFQQLTGGDPADGDAIYPMPVVAAAGRGHPLRAGIYLCHETARLWWDRFGPLFAPEIRKRRVQSHSYSTWRWYLDEVFVRINGERFYFWRAVNREGEVPKVYATKRWDRSAALEFLKRVIKRYGQPKVNVTDRLRSYRAAMNVIGNGADEECGRWSYNRTENSHQPFRRREGAMAKFRDVNTLQKFASAHASVHNHFNHDRHLSQRATFSRPS